MIGLALALVLGGSAEPAAVPPAYLYRASLVQAAPGKLLELIDLYKTLRAAASENGDEPPLWMRHSQGDRWDLLLLFPMGSHAAYYSPERIAKRERAARARETTSPGRRTFSSSVLPSRTFGDARPGLASSTSRCSTRCRHACPIFAGNARWKTPI